MKKNKVLALVLAAVMVLSMAACGGKANENPAEGLEGTYDITMWVSEKEGVADLTQKQIDAFEAAYPGIVINASIEGVTEADAGSKLLPLLTFTALHRTS